VRILPGSLRGRLVLGGAAVGIVFSVLVGTVATWRFHHAEDQALAAALSSRLELARDQIAADGSITQDAGSPRTDLVQVIGPDGAVRSSSPYFAGVGPLVQLARVPDNPRGVQTRVHLTSPPGPLVVLAVRLPVAARGTTPAGSGALIVAVDSQVFDATTSDLTAILLVGLALVVLAIAALSWSLTGRALRNVTRLTESAEAVGPSDLAAGLPVPAHDAELARLVGGLNRMLRRLDENHARELAFAADASHRLRTPIATLRAEAELALRETDPRELRTALERVVEDADQLTTVVDRMLARSRAREHLPKSVRAEMSEAAKRWQRQAAAAGITAVVRLEPGISADVRATGLVEAVEPIVDNALRFAPPGGSVTIVVGLDPRDATNLAVTVTDNGPGVPERVAAQMFDAWVSTRDASVAGGLGLWLARETARDLGGDIDHIADSAETTFRLVMPMSGAAPPP
jgi:signal transduction histidine kinase